MPSTQRRAQPGLIDRLMEQPCRFNFFQAVRVLDLWLRRDASEHGKTLDGVLRFKNSVSLSFPPSQIEAIDVITSAVDVGTRDIVAESLDQHRLHRIRLTPAFMGFLGVNGVLPLTIRPPSPRRSFMRKTRLAEPSSTVFLTARCCCSTAPGPNAASNAATTLTVALVFSTFNSLWRAGVVGAPPPPFRPPA